jgi:hypothetical protein
MTVRVAEHAKLTLDTDLADYLRDHIERRLQAGAEPSQAVAAVESAAWDVYRELVIAKQATSQAWAVGA